MTGNGATEKTPDTSDSRSAKTPGTSEDADVAACAGGGGVTEVSAGEPLSDGTPMALMTPELHLSP